MTLRHPVCILREPHSYFNTTVRTLQHTATHCNTLQHTHTLTSMLREPHTHLNTSPERSTLTLWHISYTQPHSHFSTSSDRTMWQCVAVCCVAVCCSVLQCVAVCCSVLQCPHSLFRQNHTHTSIQPIAFGVSLISISNLNLLGLFSTERGKRDVEN